MKRSLFLILLSIGLISVCFTVVQKSPTPPCFNSDEAAFSYNAFSLLKTGRDEYGTLLPLRLKSFGDYKLPLYSYLSIPFVALFGLNEGSARALNVVLSFFLPIAVYFLAMELFRKKRTSLLAAGLSAVSLGLHIVSRQAHEGYLAALLTTVSALFFLKTLKQKTILNGSLFTVSLILLLFSYHPGRLYVLFFLGYAILYTAFTSPKQGKVILIAGIVLALFSLTDIAYKPERLKNLIFFNNAGFSLTLQELKTEGGIRYLYNPVFLGIKEIIPAHLAYFSPQFLTQNGDANYRFGYPGMGILTPVEYLLCFVGIYFLFRKRERERWFLVLLTLVSPLSASLSWSEGSLTRSLFLLVPLALLAAYGATELMSSLPRRNRILAGAASILLFLFFLVWSWNFYLFHYSKRLISIHAWQCGYKQVGEKVRQDFTRYRTIYVTRDIGMPYIFMLFYLQYPPSSYQSQARLTPPDEYGFGQVEHFDKFVFHFVPPAQAPPHSLIVGSVDNFRSIEQTLPKGSVHTVAVNGEPMFKWYETP